MKKILIKLIKKILSRIIKVLQVRKIFSKIFSRIINTLKLKELLKRFFPRLISVSEVKSFWEKCDKTFAHITPNRWLRSKTELVASFKKYHGPFDLNSKTIIDYGIGGGFQGIYLFENLKIKKYIGIDIAERSLKVAKRNLEKYDSKKISLLLLPVDFYKLNADIFTSFAVIQHFPNKEYLDKFLNNINKSRIPELILQIRHSERNKFSGSLDKQKDVAFACRTNKRYLLSKLTNYSCIEESQIYEITDYQFLYFTYR